MKIIKYEILRESYVHDLIKVVNSFIEQKWQPLGSPFVTNSGSVCQAIVQYEETTPQLKADTNEFKNT